MARIHCPFRDSLSPPVCTHSVHSARTMEAHANSDELDYFTSYNDLEIHRLMLKDRPRTEAYRQAVMKNAAVFRDKVVMDIGAGTGILSLFCARAGAKRVFAVEASAMATPLKETVAANQYMNTITVIRGRAEEIELPGQIKVDIIISEWMGFYLLHESMLNSVIAAREKHLAPHGIVLPSHATIWAAPVSLADYMRERVDFWEDVYGFRMPPLQRMMLAPKKPEVDMTIKPDQMLAEPSRVLDLDLRWVEPSEVATVEHRAFVSVSQAGLFQGLALWFDCQFAPHTDEAWDASISLSTSPRAEATHWKQTTIILPTRAEVEVDEVIGWSLTMSQTLANPRQYALQLELLDPATEEHPSPCDCQMAKCTLIKALMEREDQELAI